MTPGHAGLQRERRSTDEPLVPDHQDTLIVHSPTRPRDSHRSAELHLVVPERRSPSRALVPEIEPLEAPGGWSYEVAKRAFDVVGAIALIVALAPVFLVAIALCYTSGGKPFYKHRRVGMGGRCFDCIKFRTMVPNAERALHDLLAHNRALREEWMRDHKLRDDPRVTRLGKFLRRTSLDELPQLYNVLRGEMSLVGPRPVVPEELQRYGNKVDTFLSAKPGITGLWQVSGRNDTDYRRRVALDVCYVRSRSLYLDAAILLRTLPAVCRRDGAY